MSATRRSTRAPGMTVVELLIALTITVIVGLAMATVLTSVGRGLSSANGERSALQRANVLSHRLASYTSSALAMLEADERGLAMWLHDESGDGAVNLLELRVFQLDEEQRAVCIERVVFPEAWTAEEIDGANVTVTSVEDPFEVMEQQRALGYTEVTLLVDGIARMDATPCEASASESPRIALSVDLEIEGDRTESILLSVALPMHTEPQ